MKEMLERFEIELSHARSMKASLDWDAVKRVMDGMINGASGDMIVLKKLEDIMPQLEAVLREFLTERFGEKKEFWLWRWLRNECESFAKKW